MDHRRHEKLQRVFSDRKRVPLLHCDRFVIRTDIKKLPEHLQCLCVSYELHIREALNQLHDTAAMIRLHMLYDKIVHFSRAQCLLQIFHPLRCSAAVNRVHHDNLLVQYDIRIVCHPLFQFILSFKKRDLPVIDANIYNIFCNLFHCDLFLL